MCLVAFDVDDPEDDLVGFAIEVKSPGSNKFIPLRNRINFSYHTPVEEAVTGDKWFDSTEAPFQKFRWVHFPRDPKEGTYTYRGTKMHMPSDAKPIAGTSIKLDISLAPVTYEGYVDVGFTRGFASSQAFVDKFPDGTDMDVLGPQIIPSRADEGLDFPKFEGEIVGGGDIYRWMGFEASALIFAFLDEAVADPSITLDMFAYDFNEPDMLARLEQVGDRLRAIVDDSTSKKKGKLTGHGLPKSAESLTAKRLRVSAGASNVRRTHFKNLQHHKVFIARRNGVPFKVLAGSTNFSFRGIYVQSNNALVFSDLAVADLFAQVFDAAFADPDGFSSDDLAKKWHVVQPAGKPPVRFCFSPHTSADVSLNPVRGAIEQATSSVFYSVAFLNQLKSGPTKEAFDRLINRPIFSYGLSDKTGGLEVKKPDGSLALVPFAYLAKNAPEPFKTEWAGGSGINLHHKFVVTDFNLPTAKVFTGSSNLAPTGEKGNGDHLIMFEDRKIAIAYAVEALRVFDHFHFRTRMKEEGVDPAKKKKTKKKKDDDQKGGLFLKKPKAISGAKQSWFDRFYVIESQNERDRKLFVK